MKHRLLKSLSLLILFLFAGISKTTAQELNCKLTVNASPLNNADQAAIFKTFEKSVADFMNNTNWTDRNYASAEKIDCNIFISVDASPVTDNYVATVNVQSSRPVFNSSYSSPVFNFIDKNFAFEYKQFDAMEYNPNGSNSNLVNVMAAYAFLIIGFDDDCFAPQGGSDAFGKAEFIVNQIDQNKLPDKGWSMNASNNRYSLIKDMAKASLKDMRNAWYDYHLKGMDKMYESQENGRIALLAALDKIGLAYDNNVNSLAIQILVTAKGDEITNVFYPATKTDKDKVFKIISKIDPSNTGKYHKNLYDINRN